ncbi:G protein-coupled receptor kinase 4 isoform X1 [Tursiops truncatus]|uniref:G protein-coupled receptor kinase 4 isoform X1 n=1 Tax=Tursiops truncatus TaxID=9739 RepID=UPI003CCFCD83
MRGGCPTAAPGRHLASSSPQSLVAAAAVVHGAREPLGQLDAAESAPSYSPRIPSSAWAAGAKEWLKSRDTLCSGTLTSRGWRPTCQTPLSVLTDVLDIEQFSTVKGIRLDSTDCTFHSQFITGCVSIPWQSKMTESECSKDINERGNVALDPEEKTYQPAPRQKRGFFHRLFTRGVKLSLFSFLFSVPLT